MVLQKTRLILNPSANRGGARGIVAEIKSQLDARGVEWVETEYPGHATELARQAGETGFNLVIAAGGDGTVHEVINGLMQVPQDGRPRLGILPLGSGNDFAHTLNISSNPSDALRQVFSGHPRQVDMGSYDLGNGKHGYFDNTFGMGFDATVTIRTLKLTKIKGFMMYLWAVIQTILMNHESPSMHIQTDTQKWDEETIMLVVCNGPREGGGFSVAPDADVSDGVLNYASVCHVSRLMMLRLVPEVMKGTHGRFKQVRLGQLHHLQLQVEKPVRIHADGEVIAGFDSDVQRVTVDVIPAALEVMT